MISVCICGINCKYDVECFIRCLEKHNSNVEFEVCFAHDNRVDDGGKEFYIELSKKYSWFRVIEHTKQDTVDWIKWQLDLYDQRDMFSPDLRFHMRENLRKFETDELCDVTKSFLWISSGILYNKAVSIAKGDYFLITPADFLYLFGLKDLEEEMVRHTKNNIAYAKPAAIWARISNSPYSWLQEEMEKSNNLSSHPFGSRCAFAQRDFLQYPSGPDDLHLVDFRNNNLINLADPNFLSKMNQYTKQCFANQNDQQVSPTFHGVHVISREAYNILGGFSELYSGRAFADDHMTKRGTALARKNRTSETLPPRFSIAWIGQGEYLPGRFEYRSVQNHTEELKKDPWYGKHPVPGASGWVYIHHQFPNNEYVNSINTQLDKYLYEFPPRFT